MAGGSRNVGSTMGIGCGGSRDKVGRSKEKSGWRPRKGGLRPTLCVAHLVPTAGCALYFVQPISAALRFGVRLDSGPAGNRR